MVSGAVFDVAASEGIPERDLFNDLVLTRHTSLWISRTQDKLHIHFAINVHNSHWNICAG